MEEEGTEDNGLEEDSRDGQVCGVMAETLARAPVLVCLRRHLSFCLQEDMDASLESLQNIDMMDVSVLEEAEVENSNAADFGEDGTDSILDALCESKEYVAAQLRELPAQLPEHAVGNSDAGRVGAPDSWGSRAT